MSDPFLGEVRMFGFNFPPKDWAACNGTTLAIQQNAALYSLIGIAFGGDGSRFFQLPNLAARMLCSTGTAPGLTQRLMGDAFGELAVRLAVEEVPPHNHAMGVYQGGTLAAVPVADAALAISAANSIYETDPKGATIALSPTSIGGGNVPHENRQPFMAMNFSICLSGMFPSFG